MKKLTLFFCFCLGATLLFGAFSTFRYLQSDKFSPSHIHSNLQPELRWQSPPLTESEKNAFFDQTYHYLGKGAQCFVFESADHQMVLKFIRHERLRVPFWEEKLSFFPLLAKLSEDKKIEKRIKQEHLFESCKLAFNELRDESGLLYIHLNKTNDIDKTVQIIDRVGRAYWIDLDEHEFILQKKASLLFTSLAFWMEKGEKETLKTALSSLLALLSKTFHKGIIDLDPVIKKNAGFLETQSVYIDIGQFEKNDSVKSPEIYREKAKKILSRLREWLELNDPSLLIYLDEEIARM